MAEIEIIAEAAQGYEGDPGIARLLVRAAARAGADAVKFQIVFADDLAVPGYQYYELFQQLEMPEDEWLSIRRCAHDLGIRFYVDLYGPRAAALCERLDVDGVKISTTCFYEEELIARAFATYPRVLLSIGGVPFDAAKAFCERHRVAERPGTTILYGYQAEPTPTDRNNLRRIPALRDALAADIGFMDHADGAGSKTAALSAMALALGVTVFEKHITLDRSLELEDYVSALAPSDFAAYVSELRRLADAMGSDAFELIAEEHSYRDKACKRVLAVRDLAAGTVLDPADVRLCRPVEPAGLYRCDDAIGRTLRVAVTKNAPICEETLT